jgi:hypothetical protein
MIRTTERHVLAEVVTEGVIQAVGVARHSLLGHQRGPELDVDGLVLKGCAQRLVAAYRQLVDEHRRERDCIGAHHKRDRWA